MRAQWLLRRCGREHHAIVSIGRRRRGGYSVATSLLLRTRRRSDFRFRLYVKDVRGSESNCEQDSREM
jgi:hypothetical protein